MARIRIRVFLAAVGAKLNRHRVTSPPVADAAAAAKSASERRYRAALDRLPPETRTIFLLHRAEGLDIATIAARTGHRPQEIEEHIACALLAVLDAFDRHPQ